MEKKKINPLWPLSIQALIAAKQDGKPTGKITCPKCGSEIIYVKHSNGHTWGKCKTDNCINWIE